MLESTLWQSWRYQFLFLIIKIISIISSRTIACIGVYIKKTSDKREHNDFSAIYKSLKTNDFSFIISSVLCCFLSLSFSSLSLSLSFSLSIFLSLNDEILISNHPSVRNHGEGEGGGGDWPFKITNNITSIVRFTDCPMRTPRTWKMTSVTSSCRLLSHAVKIFQL